MPALMARTDTKGKIQNKQAAAREKRIRDKRQPYEILNKHCKNPKQTL